MIKEPSKAYGESLSEGTKVAAFIVTGSTGPRCSQSTQVNSPAYQLHEPAREE